jgi:hypothetical protein
MSFASANAVLRNMNIHYLYSSKHYNDTYGYKTAVRYPKPINGTSWMNQWYLLPEVTKIIY